MRFDWSIAFLYFSSPSARLKTRTSILIIPSITKTSSNNCLIFRHDKFRFSCRRLVLIAIKDEGSAKMTDEAYNSLKEFGANSPLNKNFRGSYALLGWSGPGTLDAVTQVKYNYIEEYIGMHGVISRAFFMKIA